MRQIKFFFLVLIFSLMVSACTGYELRPATQIPTQAATPTLAATATQTLPTATSAPTQAPTVAATPTGAWLSLSPANGKPGDTVQIEGYNPAPPSQTDLQTSNYQTYTNVCWDGCQDGLLENGIETTWSQTDPGHFSLSFLVPSAPWLAADGPHNLTAGDYPVNVQYLDMGASNCADPTQKGCMVEIQSTNSFHLETSASIQSCQSLVCGSLTASPAQGAAGATIQVSGWAPLLQLYGTSSQMSYAGYSLELLPSADATNAQNLFSSGFQISQSVDGKLLGTFQVPLNGQNGPVTAGTYILGLNADSLAINQSTKTTGLQPILVASTAFAITTAPDWTQLDLSAPLWIQPSSSLFEPTIGFDPTNPARMAYCANGKIELSQNGGASWVSIPTGPAAVVADAAGYSMGAGSQNPAPTCNAVVLDPAYPQSFYAVIPAANKQYGAPPTYYLGLYTTDHGQTWQLAPSPADEGNPPMIERFGGFRNDGDHVLALYSGNPAGSPGAAAPTLVEQTGDGGLTWNAGSLACPSNGPCLQWGAAPGSISGMGASLPQFVLKSADGGQTWASTGLQAELHASGPNELAAMSGSVAVLISGNAQYPLLVTFDGGKNWQTYTLPSLPGASQSNGFQFAGLQMMPDGSLVAVSNLSTQSSGAWFVLAPGAQNWCQTKVTSNLGDQALLQPSGNTVWWYSLADQTIHNLPLSDFGCGK